MFWSVKRSSIGDIIDSNDDSVFTISEDFFQYQMLQFFSKGVDLFILWHLQLSNLVCETDHAFRIFSIFCKSFIAFYEANFSWRICFVRKKSLNRFQRLSSSIFDSFKISTNLLIPYINRYCFTLTINIAKTTHKKLLNFFQETLLMIFVKI